MAAYDFETWDVFTDTRFAGNQLAVLMNAEGLTGEQMQAITREFNYAESTFILPPEDNANTARIRIFTPEYEMPFAGHPTIGTATAIARARGISAAVRLEMKAGVFFVKAEASGDKFYAQFQNPNLPAQHGDAPSASALEKALGLGKGDIARDAHQPRRIGAGVDFIYARASIENVRKAKIQTSAWAALNLHQTIGVYLYADGSDSGDADWHVRMFAPDAGVNEDPATGSAAAAFPGQLALSGALSDGAHRWIVEQGIELGRPSRIDVEVEVAGAKLNSVKIGGGAVPISKGQIVV